MILCFCYIYFQGDSGGPLVHFGPHPMQIGILSFADMWCQYNRSILDVYISVGYFRVWIDQIVATA
jgi:secreted trypsin-like serine protease